jgi:hypothetical protein
MYREPLQDFNGWAGEGPTMKLFTRIKRFLNGDDLSEMADTLKCSVENTGRKIDNLLEAARMNGESEWFQKNPPKSESYPHEGTPK